MARKKPEAKPSPEVEAEGQIEPVEAKKKKLDGRAARAKTSPIKEWSGGMSESETAVWQAIIDKVRLGVPPRTAAGAAKKANCYDHHKRNRTPLYLTLLAASEEGVENQLARVMISPHWQAAAWMLERTRPEEYALDSSIRQAVLNWAQESGLDVADLNDLIRLVKLCAEKEIDLGAYVTEELAKRDREALEIAS